jgi:Matrixin
MRFILPLLTLTAVCVAAPAAHAWTEPPDDDGARLERFLPLAREAWSGSPCAGREVVHVRADAAMAALAPVGGDALDGLAAAETCEVWLAGGLSAVRFCTVLVHELGHLAGFEHSSAAHDIMNGAGDLTYEPCERAVRPPSAAVVDQELRALLPTPRDSWRITCGARRGNERRCTARRGERLRRFYVTQGRGAVTVVPA